MERKNTIKGLPKWKYWEQVRLKSAIKSAAKKAEKKTETDQYFIYWMRHSVRYCENCGAPIMAYELFTCQAHILPKRDNQFPSVAGVIENHMTLGTVRCSCHYTYDRSWEDAAAMPVFAIAKERFKGFAHKIAPEEKHRIPEAFLQ